MAVFVSRNESSDRLLGVAESLVMGCRERRDNTIDRHSPYQTAGVQRTRLPTGLLNRGAISHCSTSLLGSLIA